MAGGCEDEKHEDPQHAAVLELEEEAHLKGGTWYNLMEGEGEEGVAADKYSTCPFHFYLVVDPVREVEKNARKRDEEELLVVHREVTLVEVRRLIRKGKMTVPGACASLLAMEKLRALKLLGKEGREEVREEEAQEESRAHGKRGEAGKSGGPKDLVKAEAWMAALRGGVWADGMEVAGEEGMEEEEKKKGFSGPSEGGRGSSAGWQPSREPTQETRPGRERGARGRDGGRTGRGRGWGNSAKGGVGSERGG